MKGLWIGGKWVESTGQTFFSINPATGECLWEGKAAQLKEIEESVKSASNAFKHWSRFALDQRIQFIQKFQKLLEFEKKNLAEAISKEMGKPLWESLQEVDLMIGKIPLSLKAYEERALRKSHSVDSILKIHPKPHGVTAIFGPYNFPGHIPNGHLIPALIAGNTVVFKSSELTPWVGEKIAELWEQTGLPPGVFNLIQGGKDIGTALALHPEVKGIFFTGSYRSGKEISSMLGPIPHKIIALEMGGNNPLILSKVNDLEAAAYLTIQSAFLTSGQRCSCARRLILIEEKRNKEFLKILISMIKEIQIGPYTNVPEPFMGPLVSLKHAENAMQSADHLLHSGGISLVKMEYLKENIPFLSPGLIDVTHLNKPFDEEIFAPLLQVIRVNSLAEAIQKANATHYGLTASIFTEELEEFHEFFFNVDAGILNWNTPTTGAMGMAPFGGVKSSGNYHPGGYYAVDYCSIPVASLESPTVAIPTISTPGIHLKKVAYGY